MASEDMATQGLDAVRSTRVRSFRLEVLESPAGDTGKSVGSTAGEPRVVLGTAPTVELVLADPTVSRFHLECEARADGVQLRDLGSRNGTWSSGMALREVLLTRSVELQVGQTRLALTVDAASTEQGTPEAASLGRLRGTSPAMRRVFAALTRAAASNATVLLTGESGTGKELAARAVHDASDRRDGPFEVVDCGGLAPTLIESELFGHEKGAFTGAATDRPGAFERARGGTVFLDELGELPLELQPKLLRALSEHEVRRLGGRKTVRTDVRVVAATNRDLRAEINAGRFRADLFYRVAVVQVPLPPLRERLEDLPALVPALLEQLERDRGLRSNITLDAEFWAGLSRQRWPGNIRELRNYLEQLAILQDASLLPGAPEPLDPGSPEPSYADLEALPLRLAKSELLERFERRYVEALLARTGGNVAAAARLAGVDRVTLFRTLRRYGLKAREGA